MGDGGGGLSELTLGGFEIEFHLPAHDLGPVGRREPVGVADRHPVVHLGA